MPSSDTPSQLIARGRTALAIPVAFVGSVATANGIAFWRFAEWINGGELDV